MQVIHEKPEEKNKGSLQGTPIRISRKCILILHFVDHLCNLLCATKKGAS